MNFFDPVNKLLPKYSAGKVFIEGDAIILALFEREGDQLIALSRRRNGAETLAFAEGWSRAIVKWG